MFKKKYHTIDISDLETKLSLYTYGIANNTGVNYNFYDEERPLKYLRAKTSKNRNLQTEIAIAGLIRSYEKKEEENPESKEEMESEIQTLLNVMNKYGHYKKSFFGDLTFSFRKDIKLNERKNFNTICKIICAKFERTYSAELTKTIEEERARKQAEKEKKERQKEVKKLKREVKSLR